MFEVEFEAQHRRMRIRFLGSLKGEDATRVVEAVVRHPRFEPGMNGLADLREVESVGVFGEEVRAAVEAVVLRADSFVGSRWAVVAVTDVSYGIARQFELMNADSPFAVRAFRDAEQAERWLEEPA